MNKIVFKDYVIQERAGLISREELREEALLELKRLDFLWMSCDSIGEIARLEREINYTKLFIDTRRIKPYTGSHTN